MHFTIEPYVGAPPLYFGYSEADVLSVLGEPIQKCNNPNGTLGYDYQYISVNFDNENRVGHIAFCPGSQVTFRGIDPFSPGGFEQILELDGNPLEVVGKVILFNLGIDFSDFFHAEESDRVVCVFVRGQFDSLVNKMKPFQWKQ